MKYLIAVREKELFRDYLCEESEFLSLASFSDKDKDRIYDLLLKQFLTENKNTDFT